MISGTRRISSSPPSAVQLSATLQARLRARRPEIEQEVLARVYSVSDPGDVADPDYALGLRSAVSAAVAYGIAALGNDGGRLAPVPAELLSQARRAARSGVPLDTVLRRYVAGHALLGEFIVQEAGDSGRDLSIFLREALRAEAVNLDHLIGAVAVEYRSEIETKTRSLHQRRNELVRKLIAGELSDPGELGYELDAWHIGAIAAGGEAERAIRDLAGTLDRRPLLVRDGDETLWAWLGSARKVSRDELEFVATWSWPEGVCVALGEPGRGVSGWRLTHRQAAVALPIARRGSKSHVRYADVALLASAIQDEVLSASLRDLYLAPLAADRDRGKTLRRTLRAYFSTGRNITSTAEIVGVTRKTAALRLRTIEQRLGRTIDTCAAEIETALRLQEIGTVTDIPRIVPEVF